MRGRFTCLDHGFGRELTVGINAKSPKKEDRKVKQFHFSFCRLFHNLEIYLGDQAPDTARTPNPASHPKYTYVRVIAYPSLSSHCVAAKAMIQGIGVHKDYDGKDSKSQRQAGNKVKGLVDDDNADDVWIFFLLVAEQV